MASWKKVIVSGSTANLAALQVDNLTSGSVVIGGGAVSNLTVRTINGTGNIVATTGATGLSASGSFSGSFLGNLTSTLANVTQENVVGYNVSTGTFFYQGTGSFTAATASYITASNVYGPFGSNSILSASSAQTASRVNILTGSGNLSAGQYSMPFVGTNQDIPGAQQLYITGSDLSYEPQAYTLNVRNLRGTASLATTASYAQNADLLDGKDSTEFTLTSSFNAYTSSANSSINALINATSSYTLNSQTGSFATFTALNAYTSSINTYTSSLNSATSSFVLNSQTSSFVLNSQTSSMSVASASQATTASVASRVTSISDNVTNNTDNRVLTATGGGTINGETNLTFDGSTLTLTGDQIITGDLTVQGTTITFNTENLLVEDKFILLASGSTNPTDGGIIIQSGFAGSTAQGLALLYDSNLGRWGYTSSLAYNATTAAPDAFASIVLDLDNGSADVATYQKPGNIKVTAGDIFIYS
jgi:hypothetical protein